MEEIYKAFSAPSKEFNKTKKTTQLKKLFLNQQIFCKIKKILKKSSFGGLNEKNRNYWCNESRN